MKNQFIQTSLMFVAMLGISANLYAENLSAENIQRQQGRESEPVVRMEEGSDGCSGELHQPSCEALLQQISRSLQWYIESDSTRKVERVLLAGAGARPVEPRARLDGQVRRRPKGLAQD